MFFPSSNPFVSGASLAADYTSPAIPLVAVANLAIHAVFSGTQAGTFKLQASNNNSDWMDITNSSQAVTSSDTGVLWNLDKLGYEYLRVVYTRTSGSGTLSLVTGSKRHA